jgi:hypothetical protein
VNVTIVSTSDAVVTGDLQDALTAISAVPAAVAAVAVDGATTLAESLAIQNSILAGKVSGAGTGTEVFRDLANTKNRVTVTTDQDGNRSAVVRDGT